MPDETTGRAVPPFVPHFRVPAPVIAESQAFFRDRGAHRLEGTGLWTGRPGADGWVDIARLVVPEQVAETSEFGCHVELTPHAHYTLPDLLEAGELFYARIHSHPGRAYHSATDDANEVITQQGAVSIVVPRFARAPIELTACAIYYLEHGRGWCRLAAAGVRERFIITARQGE
jgi:hypothetical protein